MASTTAGLKLEIEVSQALIEMATSQTNTRCPVALSLKNVDANNISRVRVDRNEISFGLLDHDVRYTFKTPVKVRNFVDAFDTGGRVTPFKFVLDIDKAIDAKPIKHLGAASTVYQAAWRERPASEKKPRAHGWSKRNIHAR